MSNPGTTEWTCVCKDCLAEFRYSDTNYQANKARGYSRPERCPDCRKQHAKEVGTVGQPYFKVKPLFPGVRHEKLTSVLGRLNHPPRPHVAAHTAPPPEPEDKFGIKDDKIVEMFRWFYQAPELQVVVVVGPTGSGKSTYFPYRLVHPPRDYVTLDPTKSGPDRDFVREPNGERKRFRATDVEPDLFHRYGQIVVTQPRIQATRNIPGYIAKAMLGSSLGAGFDIGYQYAKNPASDWRSKLRFCTDGSLINWIATGQLDKINTVMIDEAHERSLNIDIIIGLLTQALPRYPRLKLIIASATISADLFISHFNKHLPRRREQWIEISNDTRERRKLAEGPDLKRHPDKPGWWLKRADNCELIEFDGKSFRVDPHFHDGPALDYAFLDPNPKDKEAAEKVEARLQKLAKTAHEHVAAKAVDLLKDMYTSWDELKTDKGIRKTVATDPAGKKCEIVVDVTERRGDVLGFLQGENPIQECCKLVRAKSKGLPCRVEALPLYTTLPQAEQDKALLERKPGQHEKLADRVTAAVVDRRQAAVLAIHDNVGQFDTVERLIRDSVGKKRPDLKDDPAKLVIQRWARDDAEPAGGSRPALKEVPAGGVLVVVASSRGLARSGVPQPAGDQVTLLGRPFALVNQEEEVRRVVVSTNVAETSLTIHGILHVVDSGLINQNKWNPETQTTGVRPILQSRAGCKQRWGRAGRLQAGDAWPLYTLDQFGLDERVDTPPGTPGDPRCFPYYSQPEIRRSPLEQVLLTAKKAGLETLDVATFPWLEAPDADELKRAEKSLVAKGALDEKTGDLTGHGLEISGFQAEAKLANLMVIADRMACAVEMATVLAVLKVGYSKLFLRKKDWDDATAKRVQEVHAGLAGPCRDDMELALKVYAGWSGARAAGQALADLWAWREAWPAFAGRVRAKVEQAYPGQLSRFDDFARKVATISTDQDVDALRREYRPKTGPWREWYDECRAEAERGRRARATWAEAQDTWRVVTKCPGWAAAWAAAVEPVRVESIAEEVLAGLGGTASGRWAAGLPKVLAAVEARAPAATVGEALSLADAAVADADDAGEEDVPTADPAHAAEAEHDREVKEVEKAAADARQAATTKFLTGVEDRLVECFVALLLRAIGPGPHRVAADRWLSDHGVPAAEAAPAAAELRAAVEADPGADARAHRPAATKIVRQFVSRLSVPARGATVTIVDDQTKKSETKPDDAVAALWKKLDDLAAGFVKDLGPQFRTPAEKSTGRAFADAAADATGIDELEALTVLAGDRKGGWIPRLRAAIATAGGGAWAAANYVDERALGDKDKVEAARNELIDSLSGHKKEEERRPINFALLDRLRLIFAHALPEHCYELSGNAYTPLTGADDPAGLLPGVIDKDSICASRAPGLIVCAGRRALPPGRDGKRSLGLSFVVSLDGTRDRPGPALTRELITGSGGTSTPLADWSPFAMAAHLADTSPSAEEHTAAESARVLFDQKFPLHSVWRCTLTHECEGPAQGWWVELVDLVELRKPIKERMRVEPEADAGGDGEGGGDFVQSTFAGETPEPVLDPESTEDDPATTPQGQAVRAADREREVQRLFDEDEAATSQEGETPPGSPPPATTQPVGRTTAAVSIQAVLTAAPARRAVRGRLTGTPRDGKPDRKGGTVEALVVGYEQAGDEWVVVLARERREAALARLAPNETLTVTVLGPATGSKPGVRVWVPKAEVEAVMTPRDFGFRDDPAVTDEVLSVWRTREQQTERFTFPVTVWELDAPNGIFRLTTFLQIEAQLRAHGDINGKQKARLAAARPDRPDRVSFVLAASRPELGLVLAAEAAAGQVSGLTTGEEYEVAVARRGGGPREPSVSRPCDLPPGAEEFGLQVTRAGKTKCKLTRPLTVEDRGQLWALCETEEYRLLEGEHAAQSAERFRGVVDELYEQSNSLFAETAAAADAAAQLSGGRELLARVVEVNDHGARLEVADPRATPAEKALRLWLTNDHCGGSATKAFAVGDEPVVRALRTGFNEGQLPVTLRPSPGALVVGEVQREGGNEVGVGLPGGFSGRCYRGAWLPGFDGPPPGQPASGERLPFVVREPKSDRHRDVDLSHRQAALFALRCRHPEVVGADFRGMFIAVSVDERNPDRRRVVLEFGPRLRAACDVARLGIGSPGYLNYALDQLVERLEAGQTAAPAFDVRVQEVRDEYLALSVAETWRARITAGLVGQTVVGRVVRVDGPFVEVELAPFVVGSVHVSEFGTAFLQPHDLPELAPIDSHMPVTVLGFNDKGFLQLSRKQAFRRELEATRGQKILGRVQRFVGGGVIVEVAPAITGYCHQSVYGGPNGQDMPCEVVFATWDESAKGTPVQLGGRGLPAGTARTLVPAVTADAARLGPPARADLATLLDDSVRQLASAVAAIRTPLDARDLTTARERIKAFRVAFPLEHLGISVYEQRMALLKDLHDLFLARGSAAEKEKRLQDAREAYDAARRCWPLSDRVPPRPPGAVRATVAAGQVTLTWVAPDSDPAVRFRVTRAAVPTAPQELADNFLGTSFTDTSAPAGAELRYTVAAVARNRQAVAELPPVVVPGEVGDLRVVVGHGRVSMTWSPPAAARSVEVWRHPDTAPGRHQGHLLPHTTLHGCEDTGLPNDAAFGYRVVAVYEGTASTGLTRVVTPLTPPKPTTEAALAPNGPGTWVRSESPTGSEATPPMSNTAEGTVRNTPHLPRAFASKESEARGFFSLWEQIENKFHELLARTGPGEPARREDAAQLRRAFEDLLESLCRPTLVIATTGTTSSGKSALVNLLCGAELMPVAAEEMSAGAVTVRHGPTRTLTVHETAGAVWTCGTWKGLSDEEIQDYLKRVMRAYHDAVRHSTGSLPDPPHAELEYPTFIGGSPEVIGLPTRCAFRVLDLPGLKYIGDRLNSPVIRQSREALCLVTYNSEEPDEAKQEALLNQVVGQVKQLGGSPARMLFVLNRIDAIRRDLKTDEDWVPREEEFAARVTERIRSRLAAELPEAEEAIRALQVIRLSTQPALLAHMMRGPIEGKRKDAAGKAVSLYNSLLARSDRRGLPLDAEDYTEEQIDRVAGALWQASYGAAFFDALRAHVRHNLPELVIPQATSRFAEAANGVVEWLIQTAGAQLNSTNESYERERARVQKAKQDLADLCAQCEAQLREPFEAIAKDARSLEGQNGTRAIDDFIKRFQDALRYERLVGGGGGLFATLAARGALARNSLTPLHNWIDGVRKDAVAAFEGIAGVLEGRPDVPLTGLSQAHVHKLHFARRELDAAGYTLELARSRTSTHLEERSEDGATQLQKMNAALNALSRMLAPLLGEVMSAAAGREMGRVYEALEKLIGQYWAHVTGRARELAPDVGLAPPSNAVKRVDAAFQITYKFEPGFDVQAQTRSEDTGRTETVDSGRRQSRWYTLWLYRHPVYEIKPVYEERQYDVADIPGSEALLAGWLDQLKRQEPELVTGFVRWMTGQIAEATATIHRSQQELLNRYATALDQAHDRAKEARDREVAEWQRYLDRARELRALLDQLCAQPLPAEGEARV